MDLEFVKVVFSKIWVYIKPLVLSFLKAEANVIFEEALTVIPTIAAGGDWSVTLKAAVDQTEKNLISQGITASTTMLVNEVQAAFNYLNPEKAVAVTVSK